MFRVFRKRIVAAICLGQLVTSAFAQVTSSADPPNTVPPPVIAPIDPSAAPDVNDPAKQAGQVVKDLATGNVKALRLGPLLIHGNYCGIGNRPGTEPTDSLDAACMRHDTCTKAGRLPGCSCDESLRKEALGIAEDPETPANLQILATGIAASMAILICK